MADTEWTTDAVRDAANWPDGGGMSPEDFNAWLAAHDAANWPDGGGMSPEDFNAWLAAHDAEVAREAVAKMLKAATDALDALTKPTEHGRYAEAGYNDHFNDGLSAAIEAIENTLQGEEEA